MVLHPLPQVCVPILLTPRKKSLVIQQFYIKCTCRHQVMGKIEPNLLVYFQSLFMRHYNQQYFQFTNALAQEMETHFVFVC